MIEKKSHYDVAVIGDWHLAFVTAACLADSGHRTLLVNPFTSWPEFPTCPVQEPGLAEMISRTRAAGNFDFANGVSTDWSADAIWLAVDTPVSENDKPNVGPLVEISQQVRAKSLQPRVFAVSSQVPIGFCAGLNALFEGKVAYIPENLRLGQGIATFAKADRTVIGGATDETSQYVQNLLKNFQTSFILCDLPTAEMVKHANNAFLATSISFANEMARIGSHFGVDSYKVAQALKLDSRIGTKAYVAPGLGFAGGTLPRDLRVLEALGQQNKIPTPLVSAVLEVNRSTSDLVAEIALKNLPQGKERRVLILGYTYKADTDTLRRSLSIDIAKSLQARGVECHGYDPVMNSMDLAVLEGVIEHHSNLESIPTCPLVLLMTARPAFAELSWSKLKKPSGDSTLVVDTQGFLRPERIHEAGLRYRLMWSPESRSKN